MKRCPTYRRWAWWLRVMLFLPAGTFNYWQAWAFIAVFAADHVGAEHLHGRTNPAALDGACTAAAGGDANAAAVVITVDVDRVRMLVFSALRPSVRLVAVPAWVVPAGRCLVAVGLGLTMLVVIQNGYAAATVTVESARRWSPPASTGSFGTRCTSAA